MDTRTDSVEIRDWDDFHEGDVVSHLPTEDDPDFMVTREVPVDILKPGTFYWASVNGVRQRGFVDIDEDFIFPDDRGETVAVPAEVCSDFQKES